MLNNKQIEQYKLIENKLMSFITDYNNDNKDTKLQFRPDSSITATIENGNIIICKIKYLESKIYYISLNNYVLKELLKQNEELYNELRNQATKDLNKFFIKSKEKEKINNAIEKMEKEYKRTNELFNSFNDLSYNCGKELIKITKEKYGEYENEIVLEPIFIRDENLSMAKTFLKTQTEFDSSDPYFILMAISVLFLMDK